MMRKTATAWVALIMACGLTAMGCGVGDDSQVDPFTLQFIDSDKSDDTANTTMLPPQQLQLLQQQLASAIDAANAEVTRLEAEIAKLEGEQAQKQNAIDQLVSSIAARRAEVESNYNASLAVAAAGGIFAAVLTGGLSLIAAGVAVGGLASALSNDSRLTQLNSDLSRAQSEQATIAQQANTYRTRRDALRAELTNLKKAKDVLIATLDGTSGAGTIAISEGIPTVLHAPLERIALLKAILANTDDQVGILTQIRTLASSLNAQMDQAIATLRALSNAADKLAEASNQDFYRLLALATAPDPLASALTWLGQAVAERTLAILGLAETPVAGFVKYLVANRAGLVALSTDELEKRLTDAFVNKIYSVAEEGIESETTPGAGGAATCLQGPASLNEDSPGALAVLAVVNTASVPILDIDAKLNARAAKNIYSYRVGKDGKERTSDDNLFTTIAELDSVSGVASSTLKALLAYAKSTGAVPPQCN